MNDRRYGYELRAASRAREQAQWDELKARISPHVAQGDPWSLLQASRIAESASQTMRRKPIEPDPVAPPEGGFLSSLSKLLEGGADTFRRIVPQTARDVAGGALNSLVSGESALNLIDRANDPFEAAGRGIARGIGLDPSRLEAEQARAPRAGTQIGEALERAPGGGFLRQIADIAFAPATVLTAGAGGAAAEALSRGGLASRALGGVISPVAPKGVGFAGRLAAETATGVGGEIGAEKAGGYAAEHDFGTAATLGLNLLGGLAGGGVGAGVAAGGRAGLRGAEGAARPRDLAYAAGIDPAREAEMARVRDEYAANRPGVEPIGAAEGLDAERRTLYGLQEQLNEALQKSGPDEAKIAEIEAQLPNLDPRGEQYWILYDEKRMAEERLARVRDLQRDVRDHIGIVQQYGVAKDLPPTVSGGAGAAGVAPPPALARVFGVTEPSQGLSRWEKGLNAVKRTLGEPAEWVVDDPVATPAAREQKRALDHIASVAVRERDDSRMLIENAGFVLDDRNLIPALTGKIPEIPGAPTLQDVAARLPAYAHYLTPAQTQAMKRLEGLMAPYAEVVSQTAGDLGGRADVMPGGFYLHRGFEQAPVTRVSVGGGKVGGSEGFEKEAAFGSMSEAIENGKTALAPWDAIGEYVKQVGEGGVNQYFADYMKSVVDPATGKNYAMTSADRIDPRLKKDVADLHAKITARRSNLAAQEARGVAAERELARSERATGEAGARVVEAHGRRAMLAEQDLVAARAEVAAAVEEARALGREIGAHAEQLRNTRNGLSAAERAVVAEADKLDETLAQADAYAMGAARARPGSIAEEMVTPDTTMQRAIDSGASVEQVDARIAELQQGLEDQASVTVSGSIPRSASTANKARMKEIGELQAFRDIMTHVQAGHALDELEPLVEEAARSVEIRADASVAARFRNMANDDNGRGLVQKGRLHGEGAGDDLDTLRARADLLFHVWDQGTLDAPVPDFTRAVGTNAERTAEAGARQALKAEGARGLDRQRTLALREAERVRVTVDRLTEQAEKLAKRLDDATMRGEILGDLDRASRQQIVETRRAERAAIAGDRRIAQAEAEIKILEREEARALRQQNQAETRALGASARAGQSGADLAQAKADLDGIKGAWEHTKALSRQTPEGRGTIGLAELQGTDFPLSMANAANSVLNSELPTSGALSAPLKAVAAVNNLLRGAHATLDVSFMGIQGAIGAINDPWAYRRAMGAVWQGLSDPNARAGVFGMFDQNARLRGTFTSRELAALGTHQGASDTEFTLRTGLLDHAGRGGQMLKSAVEKSNEAFGTFGDVLRIYHTDNLISKALVDGDLSPLSIERFRTAGIIDPQLKAIIDHANLTTGWSPSKFAGNLGDVLLFAPRFFQSQLELAANALTKWGPDSLQGKLARRELITYLGMASAATVLINGIQGKETDFDPTSSNFLRIRAGGRDYSLLGPWDSMLRVITTTAKGVADAAKEGNPLLALEGPKYLARTKASPMVQVAWDLMSGEDFKGNEVLTPTGFPQWLMRQVTPFSMQDLPAAAADAGTNPLGAVAGALSGFAGVKSSAMTPNEQLDVAANQLVPGKGFWELEPYQRQALKDQDPELWAKSVERGSDARKRAEAVRGEYYSRQQDSDATLLAGGLTKQAWRDMRSTRRIEQRAKLEEIYGDAQQRKGDPRNSYEKYLRVIDESLDPKTGAPDWDRVDAGLAALPAADQAEIEKSVGVGQTPLSREYARAQKEYAQLPIYLGYTADQAREIDAQWQEIRNSAGDSQLGQLRMVGRLGDEVDPEVKKALRRRALGNSLKDAPDRRAYKKRNPRFAALTGNGKLTEAEKQALGLEAEAA